MRETNMSVPQLREATLQDAAGLAVLVEQLGYPTTPVEMEMRLSTILTQPDYYTVVADVSGQLVGLVGVRRSSYYELNGSYGQIVVLVVDQAWRGHHIGQQLVAEVERWLRDQGIQVVLVNSGTARTEAHRFYQQQGYQTTGIRFVKDLSEPGRSAP